MFVWLEVDCLGHSLLLQSSYFDFVASLDAFYVIERARDGRLRYYMDACPFSRTRGLPCQHVIYIQTKYILF